MYNREIKKQLIKEALYRMMTKNAYTPPAPVPAPGGAPPGGNIDPNMLMSMIGGGAPGGDMGAAGGAGGGMPGAPPPDMGMGGAGMDMGMMGGAGMDTGAGMPPTDMSGIEPGPGPGEAGADSSTQIRSALAILKEGIKQLERAVESLAGGKTASYIQRPQQVDPIQNLVMYLNSLD